MKNKTLKILSFFFIMIQLISINSISINNQLKSELEINDVRGGFGNITVDIKNIGSEVIRILVVNITIKGGILNKINVYHNETTCVICNEALDPNDIKTITTTEEEFIFGLGPIIINIYANASNAPEIEEKIRGFVIGPFVVVD